MALRTPKIVGAVALLACTQHLSATSCSVPPPCNILGPESIALTGTVVDTSSGGGAIVSVDELFAGLAPGVKEIQVANQENWMQKGHQYLFDLVKGDGDVFFPVLCGFTDETGDSAIAPDLDYLRTRAKGDASAALSVYVSDALRPLAGATVSLAGSGGQRTGVTDTDGKVTFNNIQPTRYSVKAEKEHYQPDPEGSQDTSADVIFGGCPSVRQALKSDSGVAGVVRDSGGNPVPSLELDLVSAPKRPGDEPSTFRGLFETKTRADGGFAFDSVSPGSYLLGVNVYNLNTSSLPRTFYPGVRDRMMAIPVEVKLGESTGTLVFTLPDYGPEREITLCVVDTDGKPVRSAAIFSNPVAGVETARLGDDKLLTDSTGCVHTRGYASVEYGVSAIFTPGPPPSDFRELFREMRLSDKLIIPTGDETQVTRVLVLHPSSASRQDLAH